MTDLCRLGAPEIMREKVGAKTGHAVSADAKIPIVPVDFPTLDVVNRNSLRMRRFRDLLRGKDVQELRELPARMSIQGDQRADRLGPQDDSQVYAGSRMVAGVRPVQRSRASSMR